MQCTAVRPGSRIIWVCRGTPGGIYGMNLTKETQFPRIFFSPLQPLLILQQRSERPVYVTCQPRHKHVQWD